MIFTQFKAYLVGALLVIILILGAVSSNLYKKVDALKELNETLTVIAKEKQNALEKCSDNTQLLADLDNLKTEAAKKALAEAKKEADDWRIKANTTLFKKPKVPHVTDSNRDQYGGVDQSTQLKDYLATHQIMNEDIDERGSK